MPQKDPTWKIQPGKSPQVSPKPWEVVSSTKDESYRVFSLRTDRAISPRTGKEHSFFVLESSPWVNVIPLTPKQEVVMVRQYRHGTQDVTLEILDTITGETLYEATTSALTMKGQVYDFGIVSNDK